MKRLSVALLMCLAVSARASAQQSPRIGPFVADARVTFPRFPTESPQLAQSRFIAESDLPGLGRGLDFGAHFYVLKWRTVTFGVGAAVMVARSHFTPPPLPPGAVVPPPAPVVPPIPGTPLVPPKPVAGQAVTERFTAVAPQLSFNFGKGTGWSYISGGLGQSKWAVVPDKSKATVADQAWLKTINYGGGARWFAKKHVAFTFDVRFYAINPGIANEGHGISPRTTLLVIGAGMSVR